jgi:hypothetical protein
LLPAMPRLRSRTGFVLAALAALVAVAIVLTHSTSAPADQNPSNTLCKGHIDKGPANADDPAAGVVSYSFACSRAITGYALLPEKQVTSLETEVFATDRVTKQVVPTDSFSCNGDLPGYGVNCTGIYGGDWRVASSTFTIDGDVCAEPRVDPLLVVTYAKPDGKGGVTQYIAGPFDLGRPRGCPKSPMAGKTRIPKDSDESTIAAPAAS